MTMTTMVRPLGPRYSHLRVAHGPLVHLLLVARSTAPLDCAQPVGPGARRLRWRSSRLLPAAHPPARHDISPVGVLLAGTPLPDRCRRLRAGSMTPPGCRSRIPTRARTVRGTPDQSAPSDECFDE